MKKTYMTPETKSVKVKIENLLSLSKGIRFNNDGTGEADLMEEEAQSEAMGRSYNVWGDDDY